MDNGESKIKLENCPLSDESINEFLPFLQAKLKEFKIKSYDVNTNEGILKNISIRSNFNSEIMITVVVKKYIKEAQNFVKSLSEYEKLVIGYININPKKASIIMGQESKLIFFKKNFTDKIGKYECNISPKSFFQVNRFQTENLYKIAKEFLGENKDKNLLDLYSGIGTTSIYFSENFKKVIGVEVVKDAVKDAKENLKLNDVKNVEFLYGKSEEKIEEILKINNIDIISVDPPRKGLDKKVVDTIIKSNIRKVVYVSCNGATLTRDLKLFIGGGFELKKVKLCDMFSKTAHCEVVVLIERRFCKHIKGKLLNNEIEKFEEGLKSYLKLDKPYLYDFSNEDRLGKNHCENSYLAQMIFWKISQKLLQRYSKSILYFSQSSNYSGNRIKFKINEKKESKWFYSDVMHNAIVVDRNKKKLATKLGINSEKRQEWQKIYHTIGNLVLVPDNSLEGRQINKIHHDKNECWEPVLKYLSDNWNKEDLSFKEYIIITVQQMYTKSVFESLYYNYKSKKSIYDFFAESEWDRLIKIWNKEIENNDELEFVDFSSDDKNIAVDKIIFLIILRGYIMCYILKKL